jgi:transposase-like protein
MDGVPFRKLADLYDISQGKAFSQVEEEMNQLPENTHLSATCCNRWSGILNIDGKYVKVKGQNKKIPFVYCLDFLTHDLPVGLLAPSENVQVFLKLFRLLKTIGYPLKIVICDDSSALKLALKRVYPQAKIQLCHNHYFENLRQYLSIRTSDTFHHFFNELHSAFSTKHHPEKRQALLAHITYKYARNKDTILGIMVDIEKRGDELFAYKTIKGCPSTNNIIESYNSHLNGRLKTIKGFDSYTSAERWLNAWMIRRRTKTFTDCDTPFKHLNNKCSLSQTLKKDQNWPSILGIKLPKNALISER